MRKKKDKQNLSFIVLVFLLTTPLWAQDQQQSERSYYETLAAVKQQQSKLGSLNTTLADFAKEIDEAKKANLDQGQVKKLMAQALSVSNEIEQQQNSIRKLQNQLEQHRKNLENVYTAQIDSIQLLLQSDEFSGDRLVLELKHREIAEKRMMILPLVQSFSFDPQKINSIQSIKSDDPLEQEMLKDYLNNALSEITEKLANLQNTKLELEEIVLLEEKTQHFLEDVDTDGFVGFSSASSLVNLNSPDESSVRASDLGSKANIIETRIQAYLYLVNQLELNQAVVQTISSMIEPGQSASTLSNQEYLKLLIQIEQRLLDYQEILTKKLNEN
ncbi:hypothetical protein IIC38_04260 [candidate division KSB1 bacterium]|nr:hypothetical protein [candidate division KSB1 bacterium]